MEKLAILRWRTADADADTEALLTAADRIVRAGHAVTAFVEHAGDAAAFRYGDDPDGLVLSSGLTVWVDRVEQHGEILDHLPAAARTAVHLVTESVPLEWRARHWVDGIRSPGVALLTVFPRIEGLDDEAFFDRWHGSHSALTFDIHPIRRYVRNTITRTLAGGPGGDALVTECFSVEDLLDPRRFYGVGEPALPWKEAMARINADLVTFCAMDRLQTAPTEEIILASAPWERSR